MPTRNGNPYLLGETSEPNTDFMASQLTLADIVAKLDFLTQEANAFRLNAKRLKKNVNRVVIKLETQPKLKK